MTKVNGDEREFEVRADNGMIFRLHGRGMLGLANAALALAAQQAFLLGKPLTVLEDNRPFRVVKVELPHGN